MTATKFLGTAMLAVLYSASFAPAWARDDTPPMAQGRAPAQPLPAQPKQGEPATGKKSEEGTPAKIIDSNQVASVLGQSVQSDSGENIGRIVDVLVDRNGQVRAAVIDFGGFLGLGTRKIAVDWAALRFGANDKPRTIRVEISREKLRVAPEVKAGEPIVIISADPRSSNPTQVETRS